MRSIIKDKRGDIFQISYALIIIFLIAFIGLIFFKLSWETNKMWEESEELNNSDYGEEIIASQKQSMPHIFDELVLFMFLGLTIALVIAAARTNFNPILIFLFLILLLITILNAAGLVNIYQGFAQDETFTEVSSQLTLTNIILSRYTPLIFAVLGAIIIIIMYGKSGSDILR